VIARFVAALPHGAYFGVASLVAGRLLGPGRQGRGIAFVIGGLSVANIVGVPAITFLGQSAGWRWAYVVVAIVFALSFAAIVALVPAQPGDPGATPRRELGGFRHPQVWFALLTGMIGLGGLFAVESYIAPITTHLAGLPDGAVPIVLILFGVGMTVGTAAGGPLADRHAFRGLMIAFAGTIVSFVVIGLVIATPVGVFVSGFLLGAVTGVLAVAIQLRLIEVAPESQTLAAAANHSALNFGNSLGAYLGGAVIAAGYGYAATPWLGLLMCVPGVIFAVIGAALQRRGRSEGAGDRVLDEDAVLDRALP
jgi:DHA1 family inner membrane transport protein